MSASRASETAHRVQSSIPPVADGFPEEAFGRLAALEGGHFWFPSRNRLIVWALERYFPGAVRLLEVGCGTGVVLEAMREQFPAMELVGADLSSEALRIARQRIVDAHFVQLDARSMPFRDEFDVVCAFDVLEHVHEDRAALVELAAATRPGGGVIITVPQYRWLWSAADRYGGHQRRYAKAEIEEKMGAAGLTIVHSTAWMAMLLPIVALSRLRDRKVEQYDPMREVRIPAAVNRAFELVLDLEQAAIRRGLTLPFGASRLVVGRKP